MTSRDLTGWALIPGNKNAHWFAGRAVAVCRYEPFQKTDALRQYIRQTRVDIEIGRNTASPIQLCRKCQSVKRGLERSAMRKRTQGRVS